MHCSRPGSEVSEDEWELNNEFYVGILSIIGRVPFLRFLSIKIVN